MKIAGFSVVTIGLIVLAYMIGARYPVIARTIGVA